MEKLIVIFAIVILCCAKTKAQYVTIPDSVFRSFLPFDCVNSEGKLDTTCSGLLAITRLDLGARVFNDDWIHNLTGIQYLKNLRYLNLYYTNIGLGHATLPASLDSLETTYAYNLSGVELNNSLRYWNANYCGTLNKRLPDSLRFLTTVDNMFSDSIAPLPSKLEYLDISSTNIRRLPDLPASLKYLNCSSNDNITVIPPLPTVLETLICGGNSIHPISQLPPLPASLSYLWLSGTMGSIPTLPAGLKTLVILTAPNLASLPGLPAGISNMRCYDTKISSLPALPAALDTFIFFKDTLLTSLPALPSGLKYLDCSLTKLETMPALPVGLKDLRCANNQLTVLPPLPSSLRFLNCTSNILTALPSIPDSLIILWASDNKLTTVPSLANTQITSLYIGINNLASINSLPASLKAIDCRVNYLSALPPLPASLDTLICSNNLLTLLPAIVQTELTGLMCSSNKLSALPDLPATIEYIDCTHNDYLYCLPRLPQPACRLVVALDSSKIKCLPNNQPGLFISDRSQDYYACWAPLPAFYVNLPLCNPTNNVGNCQAYPLISGHLFYDNNANGIRDNNEPYKTNEKITLHNGEFTFTNNDGEFEMAGTGLGYNEVTPSPIRFYNAVPSSSIYSFTSFDTIVSKEYGLKANQVKDSVSIYFVPVSWASRPGFPYTCQVNYENIGTTTLNPVLTINYDNTKLTYDSSNANLVSNGSTLSLSANSFVPGRRENVLVYFTIKANARLGDTLNTNANITANSIVYTDDLSALIGGSFDPNNKQATAQLSPLQVANGKYINYTIRFQNTGTDTAFNVVISDTLNGDLRANTLEMIASSHNCKTTVKNYVAYFEFRNILLPDSNLNEPKSHGFVSFRMQAEPTVAVNTTIPNKAAIYFDYNTAVITNTASTLVKDFSVLPLQLTSFSAVPQGNNTTTFYWASTNEINTKYFTIEKSTDAARFNSLASVAAKGKATNNYSANIADATNKIIYYRLKISDNDGTFSYSPIIKIDSRKDAAGFSILANLVKDFITITTSDRTLNNTQGMLINANGAVMKHFTIIQGTQTIEMKGVPAGLYYLKTINGSTRVLLQ